VKKKSAETPEIARWRDERDGTEIWREEIAVDAACRDRPESWSREQGQDDDWE
jgi:hypothetical protein